MMQDKQLCRQRLQVNVLWSSRCIEVPIISSSSDLRVDRGKEPGQSDLLENAGQRTRPPVGVYMSL